MPKSVKDMLAEANGSVQKLPPSEAAKMMAGKMMAGEDVLIVDVRDPSEVEKSGKIKGAVTSRAGCLSFVPILKASITIRRFSRARRC